MNERRDRINEELLRLVSVGKEAARNQLVMENTGLVHSVVKRFLGRGFEEEDLVQIGCIGLIKAADRFDLGFGVKFSTYAVPLILGEIKRHIRDDGIIKVSRSLKELAIRAGQVREEIAKETGQEPTVGVLAERLGISSAELAHALDAVAMPESLSAKRKEGDGEGLSLEERLPGGENPEEGIINRLALHTIMETLTGREKTILYLRYYKEKTQAEIGSRLGISQVQVSRIEKKILEELRAKMELPHKTEVG